MAMDPNAPADTSLPIFFEIAWEVANKVGGIYTVVRTKVPVTVAEFGERYCLLGPLSHSKAAAEVEPIDKPASLPLAQTLDSMRSQGVHIVYGRWLIEGAPAVILFDLASAKKWLGEWKADIWRVARVPTPDDFESDEAVVFGYLTAWFIGEFHARLTALRPPPASAYWLTPPLEVDPKKSSADVETEDNIVMAHHPIYSRFRSINYPDGSWKPIIFAQFHEWQVGVGLILLRVRNLDVATMFTTHATLLGRYLCAGAVDFYNYLPYVDCDAEAGKRMIYHRYCIERGACHSSDVFSTVSDITGWESEHLLKRKPDGVVPNGLSVKKFTAIHEFQNLHARAKEKLHEFTRSHFYGHFDFSLDDTLYFFTAGRYEHRNKGMDMYIEGLARLNARLKQANSKTTVVAFIVTAAPTHGYASEALKGPATMKQLRDTVESVSKGIGKRILETAARRTPLNPDDLLTSEDLVLLKRRIYALRRDNLPPIVTHNLAEDAKDPVLSQLRSCQLFNNRDDRVKVVFHPEFVNVNSPILPVDYDDFVRGCHLGIFPSYYEPWGYTPAECTVMGVPSITSNLSGFGNYIEEVVSHPSDYGIYIVDRRYRSPEDSMQQLTDFMFNFCNKTRRQRINLRNRTERLGDLLDWKRMGVQYQKTRWLAARKKWPESVLVDVTSASASADSAIPLTPFNEHGDGLSVTGDLQSVPGSPHVRGQAGADGFSEIGSEYGGATSEEDGKPGEAEELEQEFDDWEEEEDDVPVPEVLKGKGLVKAGHKTGLSVDLRNETGRPLEEDV
ncbi:glycosyltransferase family 3 protein [Gonapodya prolifera JEL478]|uniref:Glycogen [starch] synthase n=1 Tax=Gonapodya prolifera (strain JEL478) TaxID=1344416 RepID=A0A139A962_GONPJ|nr:glycosyltransferase family 3 protein [Gonapodya prolifera JEL478]|eukprot:KXS13287.1 glycosyltransferase family 3 protein [Gonapodya prolifera JEL478]